MTEANASKMANLKPQKVVVPKVWKRPHSTIYGKNVEFGSKLTSDKLGEINGRKFNSELPWQMRNSGTSSTSGSSSSQGYLSRLLNEPHTTLIGSVITCSESGRPLVTPCGGGYPQVGSDSDGRRPLTPTSCSSYADVLELTNPNRYSKRRVENVRDTRLRLRAMHDNNNGNQLTTMTAAANNNKSRRIDFYENYLDHFNGEIRRMNESSRLLNDPLMQRRAFDKNLDFNYELGLFVPNSVDEPNFKSTHHHDDGRSLMHKRTISNAANNFGDDTPRQKLPGLCPIEHQSDINPAHFNPVITTTKQTKLLPKHDCQLCASPYGQSADGRKLSLGSINPHSYRPSLPHKTTTVHASDGEEFEFQDRSSPFYTDR